MRTEAARAAATIRKKLREMGINVRVTSSNYSGGSSLRVALLNDPLPNVVEEVESYCNQFKCGTRLRDDIPQVQYLFVEATYSVELTLAASEFIRSELGTEKYTEFDLKLETLGALCGSGDLSEQFYASREVS